MDGLICNKVVNNTNLLAPLARKREDTLALQFYSYMVTLSSSLLLSLLTFASSSGSFLLLFKTKELWSFFALDTL